MSLQLRRQAVVTGGTNGVGFALAGILSERGYDLILIGRNQSRGLAASTELAGRGRRVEFIAADLALMTEVHKELAPRERRLGPVLT
jgi:3-oxoacyl-[acyl-carrier protein] reductase